MIALAMALLIIAGEIDLSVASIIALASTAMGFAATARRRHAACSSPSASASASSAAPSTARWSPASALPSIVVTIGTMSLFRGIAYIVLGDKAYTGYPDAFAYFGQGYVWWVFSFELVLFALLAVAFAVLLHRTSFGRTRLRHRQQPDRRALLRHPRRPGEARSCSC